METFETLTEVIQDLRIRGYRYDFNLHPERIECAAMNLYLHPSEFHVDEIYRFEGANNPDDSSVLFAIQSATGIKGILVDAYGAYSEAVTSEMIQALTIDKKTKH